MTPPGTLFGARAIAEYMFGDDGQWRRVCDLNRRLDEPHRFPMFYIGATLCARRSAIDAWIKAREASNGANEA